MKVQIGIFECTGIMGQNLVHPYIQSTTVLCDIRKSADRYVTVVAYPTGCYVRAAERSAARVSAREYKIVVSRERG